VQPGQSLMALVEIDNIWITANFKETQLENMKPGQRVTFDVDTYSGHEFTGTVDSIAPATGARFSLLPPENATGNFVKVVQRVPVKIVLEGAPDPERPLRPGMSVTPTVYTR
jgi:membrane fusion protein (multidrug efflux system)